MGRLARTAEALPRVEGWDTAGQDNLEDQQNQRFCQGRAAASPQDQAGEVARPRKPQTWT